MPKPWFHYEYTNDFEAAKARFQAEHAKAIEKIELSRRLEAELAEIWHWQRIECGAIAASMNALVLSDHRALSSGGSKLKRMHHAPPR